jgi:hypothetical protein
MFSFFRVSPRAILGLLLGLALGSSTLHAQLDPKLQTPGPTFLDLYQASQSLVQKPEVVTVFDFSGSMSAVMFHPDYKYPTNADVDDSGGGAGMVFTLRTGNGTNTTASKDKYGTIMASGRFDVIVSLTAGLTLTNGILIRPDGSKLEYATGGDTAINTNYTASVPALPGESVAPKACDVRNWIRSASHARFTSGGKTYDLPLCWTILDHPSVQPNLATGENRKMYMTYPLKMTIVNPATGTEIEMDSSYRVAAQGATSPRPPARPPFLPA